MDQQIFKAYDIRGVFPDQFNEQDAYGIARTFGIWLQQQDSTAKKVALGSDMRLSSSVIRERVIAGLLDSGLDVDDLGLISTPTFYFGCAFYKYDGGIQISASHNPKEYNGFKIVGKNAFPVSAQNGLEEIKQIALAKNFPVPLKVGILGERKDVLNNELKKQAQNFDGIKNLKIIVDASNGMGSQDFEALSAVLPGEMIKMNFELDGSFPAHGPDPMRKENIQFLQKKVLQEKADLGIALDADGDRIFFVDEKGEVIPQAILRGILAQIELREHPGAKVAYDIRPGRITKDMIDEAGGKGIVTPVGSSLIKDIMMRESAIFGGESSGHYFYKFPYGTFEAPMLLTIKFLKYLSELNKPLSEIIAPLKKYFISEEINLKIESREKGISLIETIKKRFADGKQNVIDGLSVEYPDYWFLVRLSNTEPLVRVTIEAKTKDLLGKKEAEIAKIISE